MSTYYSEAVMRGLNHFFHIYQLPIEQSRIWLIGNITNTASCIGYTNLSPNVWFLLQYLHVPSCSLSYHALQLLISRGARASCYAMELAAEHGHKQVVEVSRFMNCTAQIWSPTREKDSEYWFFASFTWKFSSFLYSQACFGFGSFWYQKDT